MKFIFSIFLVLPVIGLTIGQEYVSSDPISYQFSYNTGEDGPAKMFREEQRAPSGLVTGKYGYVDPYGTMRIVQYEAGPQGFIARGDVGPDREAMRIARQLAEQDYREKLPFLQQWNSVAARLAAGPAWPAAPVAAPAIPAVPSIPATPSTSSVERARLTASNGAVNSWSSSAPGSHSYTNHVNHYTSNINSVWPGNSAAAVAASSSAAVRSAPLVASAPSSYLTGAPQTYFTMSSHGPSPYNIAYSY